MSDVKKERICPSCQQRIATMVTGLFAEHGTDLAVGLLLADTVAEVLQAHNNDIPPSHYLKVFEEIRLVVESDKKAADIMNIIPESARDTFKKDFERRIESGEIQVCP